MWRLILIAAFFAAAGAVSPGVASAQSAPEWNPRGLKMQRADLESLHEQFQRVAGSTAYSGRIRERARADADLIRDRLERGDFRVGDRVVMRVEGEPNIPDSLPVEPGPAITLPVYGTIPLQGILRSELETHLTRELGRFINNPVVRAESLMRVSVQGDVGRPGFYTLPADMLLGEVLMEAGGPGRSADLEGIRIERLGERIWAGEELRAVLADGRTLDQLNLRAGDEIVVPERARSGVWGTVARASIGIASILIFGTRVLF
jgi:hypothetical protein